MRIVEVLFENQDEVYAGFCAKLTPNVQRDKIIGVRVPVLRKIVKELSKDPQTLKFLHMLPHDYYDENLLHSLFLSAISDFDECIIEVDRFLPFVNNWAVCDLLNPTVFKKNRQLLSEHIDRWIHSKLTFTIRFGVHMLMVHFLDELFTDDILALPLCIHSDEYYVNMMLAWFYAEALVKQYDATVGYLENRKLSHFVHNKTIQKACESFRMPDPRKDYLKNLKI